MLEETIFQFCDLIVVPGNVKELKVVVVGMPNAGAKSLVARWTTDAWLEKPEKNDPGGAS